MMARTEATETLPLEPRDKKKLFRHWGTDDMRYHWKSPRHE